MLQHRITITKFSKFIISPTVNRSQLFYVSILHQRLYCIKNPPLSNFVALNHIFQNKTYQRNTNNYIKLSRLQNFINYGTQKAESGQTTKLHLLQNTANQLSRDFIAHESSTDPDDGNSGNHCV